MKVIIEAPRKEIEALAKAGLLVGASIVEKRPAKRRQLSRANEGALKVRLQELRAYRDVHGSFEVPRTGEHESLGEWLDKLKETYSEAPDGYRIRYLSEHAQDVLAYLAEWDKNKRVRKAVRHAPFWVSAAWAAEFMALNLRAPSQASFHPDEVAMGKWLSRWTSVKGLASVSADRDAALVASELDRVAQALRSRDSWTVTQARAEVCAWKSGSLYQAIASLCERDTKWWLHQRRESLSERVMGREPFWPTWSEWKKDGAAWVVRAGR